MLKFNKKIGCMILQIASYCWYSTEREEVKRSTKSTGIKIDNGEEKSARYALLSLGVSVKWPVCLIEDNIRSGMSPDADTPFKEEL